MNKIRKPSFVEVSKGKLILGGAFWKSRLSLEDIKGIEVEKTVSLVDELGITVSANETYFFTDAIGSFGEIASFLEFDRKFNEGWYARAESGERLVYRRQR